MYSREYIQKNILKLTNDEVDEIKAENDANPPEVAPADFSSLQGQPDQQQEPDQQGQ
jgi:hypothetical protein